MHSRLLKVVLAIAIACTMCCAAYGKAVTVKKPAVKPAAKAASAVKPETKFDQKAVLLKMWSAPDSTVVGTVNGIKVTKGELMKTLWLWNAPSQLQDILTEKMIENAAKKSGVTVSDKELQAKIDESLKRSGMKSVDELLNTYKITYYRFMDANRLNALAEKAVQKNLKVSDADLSEWIKARHILVRIPQDEKDKAKADEIAKKKIDEVYAKLKAGGDFAALANEYSEDPSNKGGDNAKGGDLGWITKGRMVQDFENAAFKLKAGEYSEPVKTFYGYHIIKVDELGKDASAADKEMLKKQILEQKLQPATSQWYQNLVENSKMDNMLMPPPPPKTPTPAVKPQPAPKPKTAPAPKTPEPASSEKPDTPPPPPPPAE